MKDDYLWDKTGEDAEIAALENALLAFRHANDEPPARPAREIEIAPAKPRRFLSLGFAFAAACAALVVVFLLVRPPAADPKIAAVDSVADADSKKRPEKTDGAGYVAPPDARPVKAVESAPRPAKPFVLKIRRTTAPEVRRTPLVSQTGNLKDQPAPALTAEEKYAYDQLRLALSITGSQLRIVKDKIDALEDSTAAFKKTK
ncbi:MAG: hypothetical protein JSS81_13020 [Acidobacteria bacterium]|nr:hypothetical protein [Acidobacteriota bacterium]